MQETGLCFFLLAITNVVKVVPQGKVGKVRLVRLHVVQFFFCALFGFLVFFIILFG